MRRKITQEQIETIKALRKKGKSYRQIRIATSICTYTIGKILREQRQ